MRQLPALDGLRGCAVAMVVLRHIAYLGGQAGEPAPAAVATFMLNGWLGVDLFFVLSGFLIARPLLSGQAFAWRVYIARRALRILPAYLFAMAAAFWVPFYVVSTDLLHWRVLYHLLFLQDYLPSDIVVAFWSLGVEEKFYLLAPLVLPLSLRIRRLELQFALLLAILLLGPAARWLTLMTVGPAQDYLEYFALYRSPFHACIDGLFCGVVLARIEALAPSRLDAARARTMFWVGALALGFLMLSHELLNQIDAWVSVLRPTGIALLMGLLVAAVVFGGAPRLLELAPLRWLGRISYSLYLIHIPLIYPALELTRVMGGGFTLFCGLHWALSLLAAQLMYGLIERPFLNLKARLVPKPSPA